jgi:hypothetical protein
VAEAIQLSQLTDDALTVVYDRQVALVRAAQHLMVRVAAEIERRHAYRSDGARSLQSWIGMRDGEGQRHAHHTATVATALDDHPLLAAALADGSLSIDHVRLLITLGSLTGAADDTLVDEGRRHTVPQLETACRAARRLRRRPRDDQHRQRDLNWWFTDDGTCYLRGRLDPEAGLIVTQAVAALAEEADRDPDTGDFAPWGARCADALTQICAADLATTKDEHDTVVLHAPLSLLTSQSGNPTDDGHCDDDNCDHDNCGHDNCAGDSGGGGSGSGSGGGGGGDSPNAMSWDGVALAGDTLRRICCDARLRLTIDDPDGRPIGIGHTSRTIPHWLLAQLRWRDQGCRFPGCGRTRWLHGHHLVFWGDGGPTDLDNLALLCQTHHRLVHEGGWTTRGHPDDLTFASPRGKTFTTHPALNPNQLHRRGRHRPPPPPKDRCP